MILFEFANNNLQLLFIVSKVWIIVSTLFGLYHIVGDLRKMTGLNKRYKLFLFGLRITSFLIVFLQLLVAFEVIQVSKAMCGSQIIDFFYVLLFMVTDLEILRLMKALIPSLTSNIITMVQCVEVVFSFLLGGGKFVICTPFYTEREWIKNWLKLAIPLYYLMAITLICGQCTFIAYKMWMFAKKKRKEKSNIKFKKTLVYIAIFLVITLLGLGWYMYVGAFKVYYDPRIEFYFLAISVSFFPISVELYHRVFHSIKHIKFDPVKNVPIQPIPAVNIGAASKTVQLVQ
ncbi:hypothetical protein BC833DRAFT_297774 [Globomyces pollinis-pini]|nr:hypothetical protein BC833DRAFT_297774 [Globomyces pollinis-pini]